MRSCVLLIQSRCSGHPASITGGAELVTIWCSSNANSLPASTTTVILHPFETDAAQAQHWVSLATQLVPSHFRPTVAARCSSVVRPIFPRIRPAHIQHEVSNRSLRNQSHTIPVKYPPNTHSIPILCSLFFHPDPTQDPPATNQYGSCDAPLFRVES